jgi:hypothetical protein
MKKLYFLPSVLLLVLVITGCKKNGADGVNNLSGDMVEETGYADDIAQADDIFDESDDFADEAFDMGSLGQKGGPQVLSNCATVTKDTVGSPDSLVIDFGPTNCLCKDGRYRRGKIIVAQTGHYKNAGFNRTITFDNYHVNNNLVYGSRSIANMGLNSAGNMYFSIALNGNLVLNATKDTISHISNRTRTFTAGQSTTQLSDDEYDITGGGTHKKATGKVYTTNITQALHVATNCNWVMSGKLAITPQGATGPRVLDFGNGTCDDKATLTVNGKTKNIILK